MNVSGMPGMAGFGVAVGSETKCRLLICSLMTAVLLERSASGPFEPLSLTLAELTTMIGTTGGSSGRLTLTTTVRRTTEAAGRLNAGNVTLPVPASNVPPLLAETKDALDGM